MLLRVIPVAVVEGAANHADRVVKGFLRPVVGVRDLGEFGVSDLFEYSGTDLRSPDLREELGVSPGRYEGQVFFGDPRIAGQKKLIENLIAGSPFLWPRDVPDEAIVGKFLRKYEDPGGNALLDLLELLARAFKICFGGAALQCCTIADAVELKIESDAIATEGNHATMYGFAAHRVP